MRHAAKLSVLAFLAFAPLAHAVVLKPTPAMAKEMVSMPFTTPTPIRETIKTVAKWTGRPVVLQRTASGNISLPPMPKKVSRAHALGMYQQALGKLGLIVDDKGQALFIHSSTTK